MTQWRYDNQEALWPATLPTGLSDARLFARNWTLLYFFFLSLERLSLNDYWVSELALGRVCHGRILYFLIRPSRFQRTMLAHGPPFVTSPLFFCCKLLNSSAAAILIIVQIIGWVYAYCALNFSTIDSGVHRMISVVVTRIYFTYMNRT